MSKTKKAGKQSTAGATAKPDAGNLSLRPGTMVVRRYRIQRRLGEGSMGEVYSAEDMSLGGIVALKFPAPGSESSWRLAQEVKVARSVSHPNVCRIHELRVFRKRVFLSMDFIDGEPLEAVLHRRVGDLTAKERLHLAHDLCAGLAAVHAAGILHRDLKPSNVMLDSYGRAVITDFGIAAAARGVTDPGSGTPEYMAPELHSDGEPSVQSDLYALGLVLYELFAGKTAFEPDSDEEADRRDGAEVEISFPPDCEIPQEAILRCLARKAGERPESADDVATALPPRPELSSAGDEAWIVPPQTLLVAPRYEPRPRFARVLLGAVLLALLMVAALGSRSRLTRAAELGEPPFVLEMRARDALASAGFEKEPRDRLYGFSLDSEQLAYVADHESSPERWRKLAASSTPPVAFWYRQSPRRRKSDRSGTAFHRYDDRSMSGPGAVGVYLDPKGRLLRLEAEPEARRSSDLPGPPPDWSPLFAAAGLEIEGFSAVAPSWTPSAFADRRFAWEGSRPGRQAMPLGVEAASLQGRPVSFRLVEPWMEAAAKSEGGAASELASRIGGWLFSFCFALAIVGATIQARRNFLRRAADATAAFRLAVAVLFARMLVWVLGTHHLPGPSELKAFEAHFARALMSAALVWVIYVALEPLARRFLPRQTASWVRLLYGRVRDPLVGRDLLLGALFGVAAVLWARLYAAFAGSIGLPSPRPDKLSSLAWLVGQQGIDLQCEALRGLRHALAIESYALVHGVLVAFFAVTGVVALRAILRRRTLSRAAALLLFVVLTCPAAGNPTADLIAAAVASALWLLALIRFGFLTAVTATVVAWLLSSHPLTLDPGAWYAEGSAVALLTVAAIAGYGFVVSLGGEKSLPAGLFKLDDSNPPAVEAS